jgi:hypothetical protein
MRFNMRESSHAVIYDWRREDESEMSVHTREVNASRQVDVKGETKGKQRVK